MPRQPYYDADNADDLYGRQPQARASAPTVASQPAGPQPAVDPAPQPAQQPFNRTQFRDDWMGSTGSVDSFLQQHPEYGGVQPYGGGKGDKYLLPSGEVMDLQIAKGANGDNALHGWTGAGSVSNGVYQPQAPQVGSVGANGMLTGSADAGGNNFLNTFRQAMLGQLQQYQQPTSLTSPTLQPQLTASRIANQRGIERAQKGLAEQAYAGGDLHTNGYGQQQQQLLEHAGEAQAATEGGLVDTAEARRQAMLGQLLGLGSSQGLQQLLAGNQLGYNYAALGQQKDLFGDQLGFNYANLQNSMNRDAMLASLGYYG